MPPTKIAGDTESTLISVKSNLMEDYRLAAPPPIGEEYAVVFSSPDDPETFAISANGHLYDIYPDPSSNTGYSILDLAFPKTAMRVAAAIVSGGTITVFAAATDNSLWSLSYSARPISETWQRVALPPGVDTVYTLKAVTAASGACLMISAGSSVPVTGPNIGLYMLSGGQWSGGPVQLYSQSPHCWCPAVLANGSPGAFLIVESVLWPYYSVCSGAFETGAISVQPIAQGSNYTMVAAAPGPGGSVPYALQPIVASAPAAGGIYSVTGSPQQITNGVNVAVFAASADATGINELAAIASTGQLCHARQDSAGGSWSQLVPIGAQAGQTFLALQTVIDPDGDMRIIAVTTEYELYQAWQDPDTSDWYFEEIEFSLPGQIQPITAYRTQITFYDNNNAPAAGVDVQIFTDQPVTMAINGVTTGLSPIAPWSGTADGSGRVVLSYMTGSIGVGALSVWSSFMDQGDQVALDPSGPTQATLGALTPDGTALMQAQVYDANGGSTPLFSGTQAEAASISQAVLQAMTLTGIGAAQPTGMKYLHKNNDPRVARTFALNGGVQPGQIDFATVPAQNWEVNFGLTGPVFQTLSPEAAALNRAARASLPRIEGILGFDCDWGDVMDMIVDGAVELVQFTVDKLADGIHASITFTINTVTAVFNAVIGWVRQALDLIERLFDYIEVGFQQMFGWLGYLFNWTDILFVKDGIKSLFTQTFTLVSDLLQYLQQYISTWLTNFNSQIDGFFQNIISKLGVQQNVVGVQAAEPAAPVDAEALNSRNVVLTGFVDNADGAPIPSAGAGLAGNLGDPISTLITALQQAAESYQEGGSNYNNFATAISYFQAMGELLTTQPDQALLNGIAGFLQTVNAIAQAAVSTINTLITVILNALAAIVEAVGQTLIAPWPIPFIFDLYSYITHGGVLSALDLGALIIAIPVTIAYKLVSSDPLPDLTQYTAAQIESMLGVTSTESATRALAFERSPVADPWDPPSTSTLKLVWLIDYLSVWGYAWVNYKIDTTPVAGPAPTPPTPGEIGLALVNILTEMAVYVTGAPCWSVTAPTTMAVVSWALGGLGIALDLATFKEGMTVQELNGDLGVILTTVTGAIYLVGSIVYWAVDGEGVLDMPHIADLVATMPEWAKILRLSVIADTPYGVAALKALGVVDVVCNILPATFAIGFNWGTLSAPAEPATA